MTDLKAFRPESWFNTRAITQPQDLETLFRLRYQVYCREQGLLNPEHYPDGLERDAFDDHSAHFATFDQDGRVAAAIRMVRPDSACGLPFQQHCPLFDNVLLPDPALAGEVSRLVLNRGFRTPPGGGGTGTVVMEVYRAMYQHSREQDIRYWYAAMERPLARLLARIGVVFVPIGPVSDYSGPVTPYLLELDGMDSHLVQHNPDFLKYLRSAL